MDARKRHGGAAPPDENEYDDVHRTRSRGRAAGEATKARRPATVARLRRDGDGRAGRGGNATKARRSTYA
jgi:hypothetical protein